MSSVSKTLTLYGDEVSPPVRFVQITAALLRVPLLFHEVDLLKGENKMEAYTKINPLQKVPALAVGDDVVFTDSHAIAVFLCETVSGCSLYPDNPILRGRIMQMLFYDSCHLFVADKNIFEDYFTKRGDINPERYNAWYAALDYLETQLQKHTWLAGEQMTLSDLCCGATVSSCEVLVPFTDRHPKVRDWMKKLFENDHFRTITERGRNKTRSLLDMLK